MLTHYVSLLVAIHSTFTRILAWFFDRSSESVRPNHSNPIEFLFLSTNACWIVGCYVFSKLAYQITILNFFG